MTIDENYEVVKFILGKNQNGAPKPVDFNRMINVSQYEYLNFLIGDVEQFQYNSPKARIELGQNRDVMQRLAPFIPAPVTLTVTVGSASYPTDFIAMVSMTTSADTKIRWVQRDMLPSFLDDPIDPIATNPVYLTERTLIFYPTNTTNPKCSYVKKPLAAVWGFTNDGNGRAVYNSGTSVNLEWNEVDQIEIIARLLRKCGVNLQSNAVSQYANEIKTVGA